jgi:hypothetical protein
LCIFLLFKSFSRLNIFTMPRAATKMITLTMAEALEGTNLHKPGTLIISVTGPMAYKASYSFVQSFLTGALGVGPNGVSSVYRYENSKKYFATLTQAAHLAHYNRLHGVKMELKDPQMMVTVEHQDKEKTKGTVSWVPVAFKPTAVKKIVSAFTGHEEAEVFQIKSCPDKWSFHFNPEINVKEIPHYATINLEGSTRPEMRLQITVQGRRPPCNICDDDDHWSTHCPLKRTGGKQNEKAAEPSLLWRAAWPHLPT